MDEQEWESANKEIVLELKEAVNEHTQLMHDLSGYVKSSVEVSQWNFFTASFVHLFFFASK